MTQRAKSCHHAKPILSANHDIQARAGQVELQNSPPKRGEERRGEERRGEERRGEERRGEERRRNPALIKSNNPHVAGGESNCQLGKPTHEKNTLQVDKTLQGLGG